MPAVDDNFSFDDVAPKIINDCPLTGQAYPDQEAALPSVPEMVAKYGLKGDASVLQIEWDDSAGEYLSPLRNDACLQQHVLYLRK